jgi:hypothetical protein
MTQQIINELETGLVVRNKINDNFAEVYASGAAFTAAGAGATPLTAQNKMRQVVNVDDFGAVGDGVTDDSAAFTAALAAAIAVECTGSKAYVIGGITLGNAESINFNNARVIAKSGAAFLVKLTGFRSVVQNFNVTNATGLSEAAFVFDNGRFCTLQDGRIQNATTAILLKATVAATGCIKPSVLNVNVETFSGVGIDLKPNVLQLNATDVFLDAGGTHGVECVAAKRDRCVSGCRRHWCAPRLDWLGHLLWRPHLQQHSRRRMHDRLAADRCNADRNHRRLGR